MSANSACRFSLGRPSLLFASLLTVGALALTGCSSGDEDTDDAGTPVADPQTSELAPEAPEDTEEVTALAQRAQDELPLAGVETTGEVWSSMWMIQDSLEGSGELDLCQQATLDRYQTITEADPGMVIGTVDPEEQLDDSAAREAVEFYLATDDLDTKELVEIQDEVDAQCTDDATEFTEETVDANGYEMVITQSVTKDLLNARVASIATEDALIQWVATYPPSYETTDDTDEEFQAFVDAATESLSAAADLVDG